MSTDNTNLGTLESVTSELTELIKANSIAYQVCGIQQTTTSTPVVFGIKKTSGTTGFQIVKKDTVKKASTNSEGFTDELMEDVFSLFGKNAKEYLKIISANDLIDSLDDEIISYMSSIATVENAVTYDFSTTTDHRQIIHNLLLKINKTRVSMANDLKRGLPKILIVSSAIAALLITNKMISGNDSDFVAGGAENVKFVGKMGDMLVYQDFDAAADYVLIAHKSYIPGDASIILIPINEPVANIRRDDETGQPKYHYRMRHAYSRNPVDSGSSTADSDFIRKFAVTLTDF